MTGCVGLGAGAGFGGGGGGLGAGGSGGGLGGGAGCEDPKHIILAPFVVGSTPQQNVDLLYT